MSLVRGEIVLHIEVDTSAWDRAQNPSLPENDFDRAMERVRQAMALSDDEIERFRKAVLELDTGVGEDGVDAPE